ncbi:hypothetical protein DUNSADRAFT_7552 [Dunaliella salina]|uniref:Secreted protein n=1 Tax=Dunaliella salina TaxID=3046 RepID=A0ABQ7GL85_DUNSA|nr:hypothetical protein DUNSADRAFT_7552 [Dunaliella salina]|eukprot:KAF5835321.1 hypothetical protein DUNSADRAFT_7552 [Dunaliella salina]
MMACAWVRWAPASQLLDLLGSVGKGSHEDCNLRLFACKHAWTALRNPSPDCALSCSSVCAMTAFLACLCKMRKHAWATLRRNALLVDLFGDMHDDCIPCMFVSNTQTCQNYLARLIISLGGLECSACRFVRRHA